MLWFYDTMMPRCYDVVTMPLLIFFFKKSDLKEGYNFFTQEDKCRRQYYITISFLEKKFKYILYIGIAEEGVEIGVWRRKRGKYFAQRITA